LNSVNEVKITPGSRVWPVAEYVINAKTEARTGMLIATALFAARMSNSERMYLRTRGRFQNCRKKKKQKRTAFLTFYNLISSLETVSPRQRT